MIAEDAANDDCVGVPTPQPQLGADIVAETLGIPAFGPPVATTMAAETLDGSTPVNTSQPSQQRNCNFAPTDKVPLPPSDDYNTWNVEQLKKEMSYRKMFATQSGTKKLECVAALLANDVYCDAVGVSLEVQRDGIPNVPRATIRTENCTFRLCNVLFSEQFHFRFAQQGDTLTRADLDSGISPQAVFWCDVQAAYIDADKDEFGTLLDVGSEYWGLFRHIDAAHIVPHLPIKLHEIWKDLHGLYIKANRLYTVLGTHEAEFWKFCNGNIAVLYVRFWVAKRPNIINFVNHGFLGGTGFDSTAPTRTLGDPRASPTDLTAATGTSKNSGKKQHDPYIAVFTQIAGAAQSLADAANTPNVGSVVGGSIAVETQHSIEDKQRILAAMEDRHRQLMVDYAKLTDKIVAMRSTDREYSYYRGQKWRAKKRMKKLERQIDQFGDDNPDDEDETSSISS